MAKLNMVIKSAWWWRPAIKLVYVVSICRIIPDKTAEDIVNFILRTAFKWRIGCEEWRRIDDFKVTLERR